MRKSITLATIIATAFSGASWAQAPAPVGAVAEVQGLVTMSLGSNVATVQAGTPVFDGARFVSSSSGGAQLKFTDGCVVNLKPNQALAIDSAADCPTRVASIVNLSNGGAAGFFAGNSNLLILGGAALLAGALIRVQDKQITPPPQ